MKAELYGSLIEYGKSGVYPFHMPGHKRQSARFSMADPYSFDLTEIDGFDNLHEAGGLIEGVQEKARRLYEAEESHLLVNGSTGGILAAVSAAFRPKDRVLVARNCHKSVYHALELNDLRPVYIWPDRDDRDGFFLDIKPERVARALERWPDIKGMILTSPTYEGVVSDIGKIGKQIHDHGGVCIVDEAHGAHLGLHPYFPASAVSGGADVVIQSLHKTMPALTQTGLLHVRGDRIDRVRLRRMLAVYQTSSPSYVLMASADQCLSWALDKGGEAFALYAERLDGLRKTLRGLSHIRLSEIPGADPSKLVLSAEETDMSGKCFYDRLRLAYGLQMEMVCGNYVLAMTSPADTDEGFARLIVALKAIDGECKAVGAQGGRAPEHEGSFTCPELTPGEASGKPARKRRLSEAVGYLAGDYIYQYPPGIPLLVPGEKIDRDIRGRMEQIAASGQELHGGYDGSDKTVTVIDG